MIQIHSHVQINAYTIQDALIIMTNVSALWLSHKYMTTSPIFRNYKNCTISCL